MIMSWAINLPNSVHEIWTTLSWEPFGESLLLSFIGESNSLTENLLVGIGYSILFNLICTFDFLIFPFIFKAGESFLNISLSGLVTISRRTESTVTWNRPSLFNSKSTECELMTWRLSKLPTKKCTCILEKLKWPRVRKWQITDSSSAPSFGTQTSLPRKPPSSTSKMKGSDCSWNQWMS